VSQRPSDWRAFILRARLVTWMKGRDGFVFGGNDSGDACAFGSAEDGAKVVGVLDAVEDENEGVFPGLFDKLDEVAFVEAWGFGIFPRVRRFTGFAVAVFAGVHGRDCEE